MSKGSSKGRSVGRPKAHEAAVLEKCEQILKVATDVFARNGYRNTDVQVIADELEMGKASIYRQYPTKQDLFFACVDRGIQELQRKINSDIGAEQDAIERIRISIYSYLEFFDDNQALVELFMQERAEFKEREKPTYFEYRDRLKSDWEAQLAQMIDDGRLRNLPVHAIRDCLSSLLYGTIFTHYFQKSSGKLAEMAPYLTDIFFTGVLNKQA